jgi:nicotinamidase/pyrazinamidase
VHAYGPGTALIVVDVQNDFADPAGSLYVAGGEHVVVFVDAEVARARSAGAPVFYTQDWHPASTPHFARDGGVWPVHCVGGTWGAELHPRLRIEGVVVRKGVGGEDGYSGFTLRDPVTGETVPTELDELLRAAGVTSIVVVGLATDYCVLATALDARERDYAVTLLAEGIRAVELAAGDGERALERLRAEGVEVIEAGEVTLEASDGTIDDADETTEAADETSDGAPAATVAPTGH